MIEVAWSDPPETPFLVCALARSRTAWLSAFLSYGGWACGHERAITMRDIPDVLDYFAQPRIGTVETAAAFGWDVLRYHVPHLRTVVVRRPVDEVVAAMMAVDVSGVATYDEGLLRSTIMRANRALDRIAAQPGVLAVDFADLDHEDACRAVFEHCLPFEFDRAWWLSLKDQNIQIDTRAHLLYYYQNRDAVERFKRLCMAEMTRLARAGLIGHRSMAHAVG